MLSAICPAIYRQLRIRTGMTQAEYGAAIGASRSTVARFESGRAQPDPEQERKMLELARCSQEELAELLCREISDQLGKKVGFLRSGDGGYEPTTALAQAYSLLEQHTGEIPPAMARVLQNDIDATQLVGLAFEKKQAGLVVLTRDCRKELR